MLAAALLFSDIMHLWPLIHAEEQYATTKLILKLLLKRLNSRKKLTSFENHTRIEATSRLQMLAGTNFSEFSEESQIR